MIKNNKCYMLYEGNYEEYESYYKDSSKPGIKG